MHRLALYDDAEAVAAIVSQTDVVRFLASSARALGPLAKKTASELGWCPKAVVSVTPDVSAIEAMALMDARHISAVAVVDGAGKIIGAPLLSLRLPAPPPPALPPAPFCFCILRERGERTAPTQTQAAAKLAKQTHDKPNKMTTSKTRPSRQLLGL